jgi:ABC-2 type transport system permease protein
VTALLGAELLKLRTTRTFVTLVAVAVGLSLLLVILNTTLSNDLTEEDVRGLFAVDLGRFFILVLGVIGMAGEWRHRTITTAVLAAPNRTRLLSAKLLAYALAGALLALAVTVAVSLVGTLILSARGEVTIGIADIADVLWRNLVVAALLGAFGVCVGGLVRNQVVAIVGLLVMSFVVELTVLGLASEVGRFLPTLGAPSGVIGLDDGDDLLAPGVAVLVMLGWVGLGFAATAAVLTRRDLV